MSEAKKKPACALCGQPVAIKGFELESANGVLPFCCEGCLSIYQLLNDTELNTTHINSKKR